MFNLDDPFFRPVWLRILIVFVCLGWGIVELATGSPGFAILFLVLGGYAVYRFFITFNPPGPDSDGPGKRRQ